MNLKTTTKDRDQASKAHTRIALSETQVTKFVEHADGTTGLSIGAGGKFADITPRTFRTLCRNIIRTSRAHKLEKIALQIDDFLLQHLEEAYSEEWIASTLAENVLLANYEFTTYKSEKQSYDLKEVLLCGSHSPATKRGIARGSTVAEYTNLCRDIANTPGGEMTPALLAKRAQEAVQGTRAKVTIFDKKRIEKEKMGALLAVAQGSKYGPRFIIMEYRGAGKDRPVVFVGKGITFDTGGLNVKPGDSMLDMHLDMSGGAAVIAAVAAAAKLGLKKNVIGLIPAAENAVSDVSFRPGDIITTLSGKTVDVLNTDAEGRLILADGLTYAKKFKPQLVVDVATLTGAALVALGTHASALMTKDDAVQTRLMALGEESGDYLWPLPLWDEYKQYTKGRFGDIANIPAAGNSRAGGTINGGMFLSHFTGDYQKDCGWAHIDMAPRMTATPHDKLAKGATGEPVRLLVAIAEQY